MPDNFERIQVTPVAAALGAEISGVNLAQMDDETFAEIKEAFGRYSVIFFHDQEITPDQHVAFAERWSDININRFFKPLDTHPMIAQVIKEPDQKDNIGGGWHTDHSYDQIPSLGSILYACEVPAMGGDTHFASMYKAYEALSPGMQETLEGLQAWHSSRHNYGYVNVDLESRKDGRIGNPELATQDALHPVVITHPDTGRKALYVNDSFTVRFDGWTQKESQPLLNYLYDHGVQPEFTCRFQWQKGSVAMWDNRATWHYATNDYAGQRRVMHRITLEGVALSA
ncbi:MAG: TauD/TfdA family dioxygenase [Rhodospirillales bacterium]|jgi:taurine dioxygenase|nr:TauD/TfdA family dioxygenase [Rhodospirillales bacterium]MBT4041349.1 TauD/TfdA family dioxygenase [Rhodospirillales bacterium]MBT4626273.1 TauD/TfdA family dioxygenase [Rhodospirillales bacterium]MBT5353059.1 TauD/TfdA family dioxygenase [Rhodospirillales bacterium]MBT5520537.1 TauD/TfdA family dioxygenase [Rhodospirillales bacterium]